MQIEQIEEDEFFEGLNQRITELAEEIGDTANKIEDNPDSSTYHLDNFFYPLNVLKTLQRIRDKARAFKENEDEEVVYVKKHAPGEEPKYYYLPQSKYDRSRLSEIIQKMERTHQSDSDLGYIS